VSFYGRSAWLGLVFAVMALPGPGRAAEAPPDATLGAPATVLARYEEAMDRVEVPKVLRFEYSVEQVGPHDLAQTHRVYRSGLTERDEILSVDGQPLSVPSIRVVRNRSNRYAVTELAPRAAEYAFAYVGPHRDGTRTDYVFATTPHEPRSGFAVGAVTIDGVHFLPRMIAYTTAAGSLRGKGTLSYWMQDKYWVVQEASVAARIGGKLARERFVFHNYDFPRSLPESTFIEPRARQTAPP
jgi:hypothetical protein